MSPTSDLAIAHSLDYEKTLNFSDDKPEVSVIVTCFNHSNFIEECLTSIFTQETNFLFEVLIGDDGSTDDSLEKIEAIASRHKISTRIFRWKADSKWLRKGRPTGKLNFIKLYSLAKGQYYARCDGDDIWISSHKLQVQLDCLKSNGYSIVFSQSLRGPSVQNSKLTRYYTGEFTAANLKWQNITGYTSSSIFWADAQKEESIRIWLSTLLTTPFVDWTMQLLFLRGGKKGFVHDEPLIFYRTHAGGVFSSALAHETFIDNHTAIAAHEFFFQEVPYCAKEYQEQSKNALNEFLKSEFSSRPGEILSYWIEDVVRKSLLFSILRKSIRKIFGR